MGSLYLEAVLRWMNEWNRFWFLVALAPVQLCMVVWHQTCFTKVDQLATGHVYPSRGVVTRRAIAQLPQLPALHTH